MSFTLSEDERKILLLALAHFATFLPTWDKVMRRIATKLDGDELFDQFKALNKGSLEQALETIDRQVM